MIDRVHSIELTIIRLSIFIISPFRECLPVSLSVFQEMPADLPTHFATLKYGMSGLKDSQALPVRREPPCGVVLEFLSLPLLHPANTLKHRTNTSRMLKIFFAFTDKNSFPVSLLCLFYHTIPEKSINVLQGK